MRTFTKTAGIIVSTGILLGVALSPAQATEDVAGPNVSDSITTNVVSGNLTIAGLAPSMSSVLLDGGTDKTSTGTPAPWSIVNARGTSAGWSLSVTATDFTSAAGTVDTVARVLPAEYLTITPGTLTAGEGSDPAPVAKAVTLAPQGKTAVTLVSTADLGKGTYKLSPTFSLAVPANAYRSNFSAAIGTTTVNPYVSTITFTIA